MGEVKATSSKVEQTQTDETAKTVTSAIIAFKCRRVQHVSIHAERTKAPCVRERDASGLTRALSPSGDFNIAPVIPKDELVPLKPRLNGQESKNPEHKKTKPPKFLSYEPYPGAMNSLEANAKGSISGQSTTRILKENRNYLDIGKKFK